MTVIRCNGCRAVLASLTAPCRCRSVGAPRPQPATASASPAPRTRRRAAGRAVEDAMRDALVAAGFRPDEHFIREFAFAIDEGRGYRADFRLVGHPILLEVEGGAHAIKRQHLEDCQRSSLAAALGWRVLRV
ncbi:MAG: hypothetical protein IT460_06850, partial [Planctomycetes bacterium]|nr:hypothetical protein [Planctomycetota bacterium]